MNGQLEKENFSLTYSFFLLIGGEYIYFYTLLSRPLAFVFVWANLILLKGGSQAIIALIFARYLSSVLFHLPLKTVDVDSVWQIKVIAIGCLVGLCWVNCKGVTVGAKVNVLLSMVTFSTIGGISVMGAQAYVAHKGWQNFTQRSLPMVCVLLLLLLLLFCVFTCIINSNF